METRKDRKEKILEAIAFLKEKGTYKKIIEKKLTHREQFVFDHRHGDEIFTLKEIAATLNVSPGRVFQIAANAERKILTARVKGE